MPESENKNLTYSPYYIEGKLDNGSQDRVHMKLDEVKTQERFNEDMGESMFFSYELKNGGHITSAHLTPPEDMTITTQSEDDEHLVITQFALEGQTSFSFPDTKEFDVTQAQGNIFRYTGGTATYQLTGGKTIRTCGISLMPEIFIRYLDNKIPDVLQPFLGEGSGKFVCAPIPVSKAMHTHLVSGFDAGFELSGSLQQIYMEGLVLQFIAMLSNALRHAKSLPPRTLSQRDIKAVENVYAELSATLSNPASQAEFAASARMSERRLNDVFKEVYGGTVFEIMRNLRLEEARNLLEQQEMSIKEIAWSVGYQHTTNFTTAFTEKFGVSPAKYTKTFAL